MSLKADHIIHDDAQVIAETLAAEARKQGAEALAILLEAPFDIANDMQEGEDETRIQMRAVAAMAALGGLSLLEIANTEL